jgi:hypothetical protein
MTALAAPTRIRRRLKRALGATDEMAVGIPQWAGNSSFYTVALSQLEVPGRRQTKTSIQICRRHPRLEGMA